MIINLARWFFGLIFLLTGAAYLTSSPLTSLSALILAALLIPPLEKFIMKKLKLSWPAWVKIILGVFVLGIMGSSVPATEKAETKTETPSEVTQTATEQVATASTDAETKVLYPLTKVIDGDTVQVSVDGKMETIRLIGIDTPESVDPRKPVQCFATEASNKAKELLTNQKVSLEADSTQDDKDKYNRLLRYVFLEDGTNFSKLMISEGYGHQYTYIKPYKYMEEFKQAELEAREAKRGLWADEACLPTPTPIKIVVTPKPTVQATPKPTTVVTSAPANTGSGGGYSCAGKTTCGQMGSCAEARFYLTNCGVSRLDGDKDGTPCESLCN